MIEFTLWTEERDGDRRISVDPRQILYYSAVYMRRAFEFWQECTKISLTSGETFMVAASYGVVKAQIEGSRLEEEVQ